MSRMPIRSVRFQEFKALRNYSMTLEAVNVLVGPNNAGKSSILDAFRLLGAAIRHARRRRPRLLSVRGHQIFGYDVPVGTLPVPLVNVHSETEQDADTKVEFTLQDGSQMRLDFVEASQCILTLAPRTGRVDTPSRFKSQYPIDVVSFPTLGPFEDNEELLTPEYVAANRNSRRSHRLFRNIWYHHPEGFDKFRDLLESSWKGMSVERPERWGFAPPKLNMYCLEGRKSRELSWSGFGFQVWLQILTQLVQADEATTLIIDEPEIYLHPDLQRRLFDLLKSRGSQIVLATHSAEIVNEAEHDDVVIINSDQRSAKRVKDIGGLQRALFSIGSAQNIHLAKLSKERRVLFLEGKDFRLIRRFADRLGLHSLASDLTLTVVPIGGFSLRHRIEDAAWTFEQVLQAEISIAALLDRDYRCAKEIREITEATRKVVPDFYILGRKEIENYLLVPSAVAAGVRERLRAKGASPKETEAQSPDRIADLLRNVTDGLKSEVAGNLIGARLSFEHRSKQDSNKIVAEVHSEIETKWSTLADRLALVPGKTVLGLLNERLRHELGVNVSGTLIIRHMQGKDFPPDLLYILKALEAFASQPPSVGN